jgi:hypothetical protein
MKIGTKEAALARLVDDKFIWPGGELIYNVMSELTPNEKSAHGAYIPNPHAVVAVRRTDLTKPLCGRQVGQVWLMTLAGVYDMSSSQPEHLEDSEYIGDNFTSLGKDLVVAALGRPKATWIDKVSLDVNDDERRCRKRESEAVRTRDFQLQPIVGHSVSHRSQKQDQLSYKDRG